MSVPYDWPTQKLTVTGVPFKKSGTFKYSIRCSIKGVPEVVVLVVTWRAYGNWGASIGPGHWERRRPLVPRAPHHRSAVVYKEAVVVIVAVFLCQIDMFPLMIRFRKGTGFVVTTVLVWRAFDTYRLPVTFRLVRPVDPVRVMVFAETLVVVRELETTRFAKGWVTFDEFMFEIVFPKMSAELMTPKARFEAFRLLRVFPKMSAELMTPKARFEAFRLLRVFPVAVILDRNPPSPR
jgi:hypothetical protein